MKERRFSDKEKCYWWLFLSHQTRWVQVGVDVGLNQFQQIFVWKNLYINWSLILFTAVMTRPAVSQCLATPHCSAQSHTPLWSQVLHFQLHSFHDQWTGQGQEWSQVAQVEMISWSQSKQEPGDQGTGAGRGGLGGLTEVSGAGPGGQCPVTRTLERLASCSTTPTLWVASEEACQSQWSIQWCPWDDELGEYESQEEDLETHTAAGEERELIKNHLEQY